MSGPTTEAGRALLASFDGYLSEGRAKRLDVSAEAMIADAVRRAVPAIEAEARRPLEAALRTEFTGSEWQRLSIADDAAALLGLTLHDDHWDAPGRCHDDEQDCPGCGGAGYDTDLASDDRWHYPPCAECDGTGIDVIDAALAS